MMISVIADFGYGDEVVGVFDELPKATAFQQAYIKKHKNKLPTLQTCRLKIEVL